MERPILFRTAMIQAIMDGRKTQTRRTLFKDKYVDPELFNEIDFRELKEYDDKTFRAVFDGPDEAFSEICPYGKPGDILWVRETFYAYGYWITIRDNKTKKEEWHFQDMTIDNGYKHRFFDNEPEEVIKGRFGYGWYKRPSIFMPKEACRIKILVKDIRVERLQDISKTDAADEGVLPEKWQDHPGYHDYMNPEGWFTNPKWSFCSLWQSIHGEESWNFNPWLWVVEFERILS